MLAEAPDRLVDQSGQAWQTPELQWLQKAWGFAAPQLVAHTYYMYLSPWRPPGQRPLNPDELAYCQALLRRQLSLSKADYVLCLGAATTRALTAKPIKNNTNQWLESDLLAESASLKLAPLPNTQNMLMSALSKKAVWQQLLGLAAQI